MVRGSTLKPYQSRKVSRLEGRLRPPGDKSISHRALMLGGLAVGETTVRGLLEGEDVLHTAAAMRLLGATVARDAGGVWKISGVGVGGLGEPADVIDLGNSGTSARLLSGLLATSGFVSFVTGDDSLRRRPMRRVTEPLSLFGAQFLTRSGLRLPMAVIGTSQPMPVRYVTPVPSAQVKSAVLLAGLNTMGETTVVEREATRDHSEIMLAHFGASLRREETEDGTAITIVGQPDLVGRDIEVPGDPSSAAFPVVAACIAGASGLTVEHVGVNPLRTGLYTTLAEMGARIEWRNERVVGGEKVADLHVVGGGELRGVEVPAERAPSMIDEYPVLAVAAACARGTTIMRGLAELKVKESDRLAAIAAGLVANGIDVEIGDDSLTVHGRGGIVPGGGAVATHMDHRIAMSFLVLGMAARQPVTVDDIAMVDTSFPGFVDLMNGLGASIAPAGA
ncbi:MAG: 3-phosphoshikimate 1-carboxyvinyltransferase [Reyranella sp.]|uniref:3-phosphoshikimate 1-carboxyvinyltransferase n=1 Tax=Reyranella sp. TaxID=1929291 RepID=UPI003D1509AB